MNDDAHRIRAAWSALWGGLRRCAAAVIFLVGSLWLGWQSLGAASPALTFLKYPVLAGRYLDGTIDPERLLDVSFLYFYVHVVARRVSSRPEILIQVLQVAALALAAALLFQLVRRLVSPGAALVAAALLLLDRTVAVYAPILEPEAFLLTSVVAFLWLATSDRRGAELAAGVALGVALLLRPALLPMVLVVPTFYRLRGDGWGAVARSTAVFLLPVMLALGGLWTRNARLPTGFSPAVMNPGEAFFEGSHPWATGLAVTYPPLFDELLDIVPRSPDPQHELYRVFARRTTGKDLSPAAVNRFWRDRGLAFLRDHPRVSLRRAMVKVSELFRGYAWHDLSNAYWRHRGLAGRGVPAFPFALVAAAGLLGMVIAAREWRRWLLLYGVLGCQLALMVVVYVSARQKMVAIPVLAAFAALAVFHVVRRRGAWPVVGAAIVLLAGLLWLPNDRSVEDRYLWEQIRQSNALRGRAYALRSQGRREEAAEAAARSLALTPWRLDGLRPAGLEFGPGGYARRALAELATSGFVQTFSRRLDQATLALAAGAPQTAESALAAVEGSGSRPARGSYQSSEIALYRAELAILEGDRERGRVLLTEALDSSPGDPAALALMSVLTGDSDYRDRIERYFDPIHAHFFVGRAHLRFGDPERAADSFRRVVDRLPELRRAKIYLAASLGAAGRTNEGARLYLETVTGQPDPVLLEEEIVVLFRRWAEEGNGDPERMAAVEAVLRSFGLPGGGRVRARAGR